MTLFSLNSLIDDILLIIRNNAISQSEDLSRAQIESWIHHYRALLIKQQMDKGYDVDLGYCQTLSVVQISQVPINTVDAISATSIDQPYYYKYKSSAIPKPINLHYGDGIVAVMDMYDGNIQQMSKQRRHFQRNRKFTKDEYTYYYEPDYIYVQGPDALRYIKVVGVFEDPIKAGLGPDDVYPIPASMIPTLKQMIFANELKFMLAAPSDDRNDASLDTIKNNGETK